MHGTSPDKLKREAATRALDLVESGMVLGLGTGSTVAHFLEMLGERIVSGELTDVVGVATSIRTGREARQAGIPLVGLGDQARIHLTVDGADEISPELDLVKGMGGALLREKMVTQASDRIVIIADDSKLVPKLGTRSAVPVEVVDWGQAAHIRFLESRGAVVAMRMMEDGPPFKSDNGNLILDCTFPGGVDDPHQLDADLHARAGVVETGLFLGTTDMVIIASESGIEVREAPR